MALSTLQTKMATTPPTGRLAWDSDEAIVECLHDDITNLGVAPVNTTADAGSNSTKVVGVQGVTGGKSLDVTLKAETTKVIGTVNTAVKQYAGVPSSFTIQTADQTVFTLAAGEIGFIQNLSADAPLAVKLGAAASTTSLNFILAKGGGASDGTGGAVKITDWVGVVSVAKMTGTASYLAYKQAVS